MNAREGQESSTFVVHCDLSWEGSAEPLRIAPTTCLAVLWWRDCPVGQLTDLDATGRALDRSQLLAAVPSDILSHAKELAMLEASKEERKPIEASVVICTRDRSDALTHNLASLRVQTTPPAEVIVVDNASKDDRTREAAHRAAAKYIREDRPGLDFARNAGARAARGEIVAYTDDDVQLHPRWLERLVRAFDAPEIMAVTGLVLPAELATPAQRHFEAHWGFGRGFRRRDFGAGFFAADRKQGCPVWEIGAGASMAFRRRIFHKIGLFDERLDVGAAGCSGDSEYWHRILSNGGMCRYEPSAVAYHFHRRDLAELENQLFNYMRGHAAALLVQFERSGNFGNLRRAFVELPKWYASRWLRQVVGGAPEMDRFLRREVAGFLAGIAYYFRQPRPVRQEHAASTDDKRLQ